MPDREKVIKCLTDLEQIMITRQEICPPEELQYWIELQEGVADALALLKEQEPKTGYWIESAGDDKCSVCGATYSDLYPDYQHTHYCPNCGAKMIG